MSSKPLFIESSVVSNRPLNLCHVIQIYTHDVPPQRNNKGYFAIVFVSANDEFIWRYSDAATRDKDYKYIMDRFSVRAQYGPEPELGFDPFNPPDTY